MGKKTPRDRSPCSRSPPKDSRGNEGALDSNSSRKRGSRRDASYEPGRYIQRRHGHSTDSNSPGDRALTHKSRHTNSRPKSRDMYGDRRSGRTSSRDARRYRHRDSRSPRRPYDEAPRRRTARSPEGWPTPAARYERTRQPREANRSRKYRFDSPPREHEGNQFGLSLPVPLLGSAICASSDTVAALTANAAGNLSSTVSQLTAAVCLDANATKTTRELFIGNLPPDTESEQLLGWLQSALESIGGRLMPGFPCSKCWISSEKLHAFVEFRSREEAANGLLLNGVNCRGFHLQIDRPSTCPTELSALAPTPTIEPPDVSFLTKDITKLPPLEKEDGDAEIRREGNSKICQRLILSGIDTNMEVTKVEAIASEYGALRHFEMARGPDGQLLGVATYEFEEKRAQDKAFEEINKAGKYKLEKSLVAVANGTLSSDVLQWLSPEDALLRSQIPTRCILLMNLVHREELMEDNDYIDIVQDIKFECDYYGTVKELHVPQPSFLAGSEHSPPLRRQALDKDKIRGVGFAFVLYDNIKGAARARKGMSGRRFAGRVVETAYFSEVKFMNRHLENPQPNYCREGLAKPAGTRGQTSHPKSSATPPDTSNTNNSFDMEGVTIASSCA